MPHIASEAINSASGTNGTTHGLPALNVATFQNCINGKLVDTKAHRRAVNPANLEPGPDVPCATKEDLDKAVDAAKTAFKHWSKVTFKDRRAAVMAYADAMEEIKEEFIRLLTTEQGKPIFQATFEVDAAIEWMRGMARLNLPEEIIEDNEKRRITTRYVPLGVVGAIVPWNFPTLLATAKIAPAILTGNTIIVKPSPFTPYSGLKLVELAQGFFPPGVVQVLSGDDNLGPWLTSHPGIDKISFTGSTATGKLVALSAAKTLKRVTLELGGNDPAIVCPDVNIDKFAPQIATFAFLKSGQICLCIKRIYIHKSIYASFREALVNHIKTLKVGDGFDPKVFCGPLQNSMQYERVKGFFADIGKENWQVAVGGEVWESKGYFIDPTIIDNPAEDSRIVVEEPFGPIVPILSWENEDEVIARANQTRMGLGASVWSSDLERANRIARQLEAGTVWVNNHFDLSPLAPFGGVKESGVGVEWGVNGLKRFCNSQTLMINKEAT